MVLSQDRRLRVYDVPTRSERANLEVILARLTTGVVSLESDLRIRTANQAAGAILIGVDLGPNLSVSPNLSGSRRLSGSC